MARVRIPSRVLLASFAATGAVLHEKPSIYPSPPKDILLQETPSQLEKQIGVARVAVTEQYTEAHARVQALVSQWIGVEHSVEARIKSLISPTEPLTPGLLYVGIATLTGSIIGRSRILPVRLALPPIAFLLALNQFLPQTAKNVNRFGAELEERYLPTLAQKHDVANAHTAMAVERVKEAFGSGREHFGKAVESIVDKLQSTSGLKLKEILGRGQAVVEDVQKKAEAVKPETTKEEKTDTPKLV